MGEDASHDYRKWVGVDPVCDVSYTDDEQITFQPTNMTICWAPVSGALSYNIYRSVASDGRSQNERLIQVGIQETSFTDNGQGALTPAPGNLRGRGVEGGSLTRIFSSLIVVGGANADGLVQEVESTRQ